MMNTVAADGLVINRIGSHGIDLVLPEKHGLTLIPAWISNYMPSKMCDEISNPFPNFNSRIVEFRNG